MASAYPSLLSAIVLLSLAACGPSTSSSGGASPSPLNEPTVYVGGVAMSTAAPNPDPRIGLRAGRFDAAEAAWNMRVLSRTRPSERFLGVTNSDLAFKGNYVIQGNYNGWQIWDISNPSQPALTTAYYCPASQSDVSVYKNLLFVSGEGVSARIDCGGQGVRDTVSTDRLRGLRVFDISDIAHPRTVGNVQTCRGSHTHTVVVDPKDTENVYVYISGSAPLRSPNELPGCIDKGNDPTSAKFRIEVIKVPVANPERAAIVNSPRIFNDLVAPARHGEMPEDIAAAKKAAEAASPLATRSAVWPVAPGGEPGLGRSDGIPWEDPVAAPATKPPARTKSKPAEQEPWQPRIFGY